MSHITLILSSLQHSSTVRSLLQFLCRHVVAIGGGSSEGAGFSDDYGELVDQFNVALEETASEVSSGRVINGSYVPVCEGCIH